MEGKAGRGGGKRRCRGRGRGANSNKDDDGTKRGGTNTISREKESPGRFAKEWKDLSGEVIWRNWIIPGFILRVEIYGFVYRYEENNLFLLFRF